MDTDETGFVTEENLQASHHYGRALIESVVVLRIEEASGLDRIVDTAVPRVGEVEDAIREARLLLRISPYDTRELYGTYLHETGYVRLTRECNIRIPNVREVLRALSVLRKSSDIKLCAVPMSGQYAYLLSISGLPENLCNLGDGKVVEGVL